MRKFLKVIAVVSVFLFSNLVYAQTKMHTPVRCIYINGANNNTPSMQQWFYDGINKLHPQIKHYFETSQFVHKYMLKDGELKIENEPGIFFWGNKTLDDLNTVNEGLITTSMLSPKLAQIVRSLFAHCMHDAIWVQKPHNMQIIINDLHKQIQEAYMHGEKVILFGYSAGSFVTYKYLFYKLTGLTANTLAEKMSLSKDELDYVKSHKINPTCIDAITVSRLAVYSANNELIPNPNFEMFKQAYSNLNKTTREACIPDGTVMGIVNYASPLVLFYSEIKDPTVEINKYNEDLFISMKNNNLFWITVNFADDPLGYPLTRNLTGEEISKLHNIKFDQSGKGFFHDKSDIKSPATFLGAHTSYWRFSKKFAKAVVDAYKEGYENFYPANDTKPEI